MTLRASTLHVALHVSYVIYVLRGTPPLRT